MGDQHGGSGAGQGVALTSDSGYFWFFNSANIELVVKVLDACTVNDHFWVFAGGLTNVDVVMTITDTETGAQRTVHQSARNGLPAVAGHVRVFVSLIAA